MYAALDLAKYIISKCTSEGEPITNLQLQKILYYIQKEFLKKDELAFPDNIEAWQFGPVVRSVYYYFCIAGGMPISLYFDQTVESISDKILIDNIVEEKSKLDPWDLVRETHASGGAWDQIYNNGKGNKHVIPTYLIKAVG